MSKVYGIIEQLLRRLNDGDERSRLAKRNILLAFLNKGVAILVSLAIIPITIDYLDGERYGIWLTLSSIVAWISFFDIGLGHGFRNRFAEAKSQGNEELARRYVSTTYWAFVLIFGVVLISLQLLNPWVDWPALLLVSPTYGPELSRVVSIVLTATCFQFVVNVFPLLLTASQRPAASAMINTGGQVLALLVVWLLTLSPLRSMAHIAWALAWCPVLVTLIVSVCMYAGPYRRYAPSWQFVDRRLIRQIVGLGGKFFVIQIAMILIFQVTNVILSRVLGPAAVTEYNVAYKYFSITLMAFNIILSPYWSAFTDAYTLGNYDWMKNIRRKLIRVWFLVAGGSVLLLLFSPWLYPLWLGGEVSVSWATSVSMFIFMNTLAFSTMCMTLLNGTGKVFLQTFIYAVCALFAIPASYALCGEWGIPGTLAVLTGVYVIQGASAYIQLGKLLSGQASGVWNRG